jgi:TetR/AcrR family transcriptional repressor of nem operon
MATKGERTRARIVERSAALMNHHGFAVASMAAVVAAAGIQKGGLYRHFESRESLAAEAFDFAVSLVRNRFAAALEGKRGARAQLLSLLDAYDGAGIAVPLAGGCPIMNTAIETDHADPALRARARAAMDGWHAMISAIVVRGLRKGEVQPGVGAGAVASIFIACIEGGVMLTQLYGDAAHLSAALGHLRSYVERDLCPTSAVIAREAS